MAFVEIEDTQSSLEVIVFPRTFETYKHLLNIEDLILVAGKVDGREEGRPKILADSVSTEFTIHRPIEDEPEPNNRLAENGAGYTSLPLDNKPINGQPASPTVAPEPPPPPWVNVPDPLLFILPRSNDLAQDTDKLITVYKLLQSHPGERKFELCIPQNGHGVVIEYDLSIHYDTALKQQLQSLGVTITE